MTTQSDVAISTQMITFTGTVGGTTGNWNAAQTITVTSPVDVDAADEMATIDHTVLVTTEMRESPQISLLASVIRRSRALQ